MDPPLCGQTVVPELQRCQKQPIRMATAHVCVSVRKGRGWLLGLRAASKQILLDRQQFFPLLPGNSSGNEPRLHNSPLRTRPAYCLTALMASTLCKCDFGLTQDWFWSMCLPKGHVQPKANLWAVVTLKDLSYYNDLFGRFICLLMCNKQEFERMDKKTQPILWNKMQPNSRIK